LSRYRHGRLDPEKSFVMLRKEALRDLTPRRRRDASFRLFVFPSVKKCNPVKQQYKK
jgi:hypothetical protein